MRELTQKEIDDAPDWAKYYTVNTNNAVSYDPHKCAGYELIKEFDISEYDFGEFRFIGLDENKDVELKGRYRYAASCINKQDAIALAKHFKLTASDLS